MAFTGVPTEGDTALPMQKIVLEEIDLFGVRANRNTMEEVIPLVVSGRVRIKPLVTHTFGLADYGKALQNVRRPHRRRAQGPGQARRVIVMST